ncbi:MAG: preprotein translocase subunit SecG [Candidatus Omnitrophica bacterium]|nr:preprotein translocase subunit SecG [Candidatus Omnitrophota bacterium]MDD5591838.1 preprotein translocase subunit SecG [Candidatus Omnitrophota bacterium]
MTFLIITIHVVACTLLITIILIQRGRGGGLAESFSGVESMFGTKTNAFLSRTTTVLSAVFFVTCLSLAVLSVRQSRSLMQDAKPTAPPAPATAAAPVNNPIEQAQQELPKPTEKSATASSPEVPKAR